MFKKNPSFTLILIYLKEKKNPLTILKANVKPKCPLATSGKPLALQVHSGFLAAVKMPVLIKAAHCGF